MPLTIITTLAGFTVDGVSYPAVPVFVDDQTLAVSHIPTEWMLHLAVVNRRVRSPKTWKKYSLSLLAWLRFSEEKQWDWMRYNESSIAHFRNLLEAGKVPSTPRKPREPRKRPYSRNTIRRHIATILAFYEWGVARGLLAGNLVESSVLRGSYGLLSHLDRRGSPQRALTGRGVLLPKAQKAQKLPNYFTDSEIASATSRLCRRDILMVLWALHTGAREFEICELLINMLPNEAAYQTNRYFAMHLTKTKNSKPGDIYVPSWLLDETYRYAKLLDRRTIVSSLNSRSQPIPEQLWLTQRGAPMKPDSIYRAFKAALRASGLRGTFHDLRHTYAINTLDMLLLCDDKRRRGKSPEKLLKIMMRHESEYTTEQYLTARDLYTDVVRRGDLPNLAGIGT
jgi:integrase